MSEFTFRLGETGTLLDRMIEAGVPIAHDCGGALACASCRVVVRDAPEELAGAGEDELDMLERAGEAAPNARLACQVKGVAGEFVVEVPCREAPPAGAARPVMVSPRAARHLAAQLARHPGAALVRLSVEPSGCSGFGYRVDPAPAARDGDTVFDCAGVRLVVDAASLPYVQGTVVDLEQAGLAQRLRFDNPNARQSCGCGESFAV